MLHSPSPRALAALLLLAVPTACVGGLDDGPLGPTGAGPRTPSPSTRIQPSSVRRLGRIEYERATFDVVGAAPAALDRLNGDRIAGFTTNAALFVDDDILGDVAAQAEALATDTVRNRRARIVTCDASSPECPRTFVTSIAARAFRRPASPEEIEGLLAIYEIASDGAAFDDGAIAVLTAVLQSASFLYVPQIGVGRGDRVLDPYETASAISFLLTAAPPDEALLEDAAGDALRDPDVRAAHARRLLAEDPRARAQIARFVAEWLELDGLRKVAPISDRGDFATLRPLFEEETRRFAEAVLVDGEGTIEALLTADFTIANGELAAFYGLPEGGDDWARRDLGDTARRGILAQGAFLAGHARVDSSSPVRRGVSVLSRLLCQSIPFPTGEVGEQAMVDPPPARTTRERFAQHASDGVCAGCHSRIDPIGFGLEHFDQLGAYRADENGVPIDASGTLVGTDVDGAFADGRELVTRLASSDAVHACFARNVYRFATGTVEPGPETTFLARWRAMPEERRTSLTEVLVELIASDLFVGRKETP